MRTITVNLGAEYDEEAVATAGAVLKDLGAEILSDTWGVGGSQEVSTRVVRLRTDELILRAETYMGLTLTGPEDLAGEVGSMILDRLQK